MAGLMHPFSGVFPLVSYLHVPGKMSKPLWLMLGTCFLVDPRCVGWEKRSRFLLLSSAHTFAPWAWMSDASQLKIPAEFQKSRYVVARLHLADPSSLRAVASDAYDLHLAHVHPTLDVCALTMRDAQADAFEVQIQRRRVDRAFTLSESDPDVGDSLVVSGFRGLGRLGQTDTMDASALHKLPKEEQAALLKDLENVEGKQEGAAAGMAVLRRGVARVTTGECGHGMSGGPVQRSSATQICDGVLYGKAHQGKMTTDIPPGEEQLIGYIPSTAVLEWLKSVR